MIGNKKGWLRIVEAFMAVILIAGVIFIILFNKLGNGAGREETIYNLQETVLDQIENNYELREAVLRGNSQDIELIKTFVSDRIPAGFLFDIKICELDRACGIGEYKENVYVNEVIISAILSEYNPRKLKLFMWEE